MSCREIPDAGNGDPVDNTSTTAPITALSELLRNFMVYSLYATVRRPAKTGAVHGRDRAARKIPQHNIHYWPLDGAPSWHPVAVDRYRHKARPRAGGRFEAIAEQKAALDVSVELAPPDRFKPALPGWRDRSESILTAGNATFRHYDYYAQALSKIERGYSQDVQDARDMVNLGLVRRDRLLELSRAIMPTLPRYPAIDPDAFMREVRSFIGLATAAGE